MQKLDHLCQCFLGWNFFTKECRQHSSDKTSELQMIMIKKHLLAQLHVLLIAN